MQQTLTFPQFALENGTTLRDVPVAYETWGTLNEVGDNAVVVCHALTGNTAVDAWWGELLGPDCALDPRNDFIVCLNVPGSPYGSISPVTTDPSTETPYGSSFPAFTIRDTVALHRRALERLGVRRVLCAIGGSMGGMQVLEWAFESCDTGEPFVQSLIPVAVGGRHTAWQIGWSEAQRQAIYADPSWQDGEYEPGEGPTEGLATARMMAMVSYRSHRSFDERFGRESARQADSAPYAVESYLRHHGEKLVSRFDANCYVHLTRQMDTHDIARGRGRYEDVLGSIAQPSLVVGIDSDVLYPLSEQCELVEYLPRATLDVLRAPHGHDSFLIEVESLNQTVSAWRRECAIHSPTS